MNGQIPVIQRPVQLDVVKVSDTKEMETEINKRLKDGFLFHGDMKIVTVGGELVYIQAMVKTEIVPMQMPRGSGSNILVPQ
jgi:hypothetical protein